MVTSASSTVFHGCTVTDPNAFDVTVAELELSPQSARIWTEKPGVVLPGLTCTQTPLRTAAGAARGAVEPALAPAVRSAQALRPISVARSTTAPSSMRIVRIIVPLRRHR